MVIDANMYWFPEELFGDREALDRFIAEAPRFYGTNVYLKKGEGPTQIVVEKPEGFPSLNYAEGDYRLETMLADMDEAGVDRAILKVPGCNEWMSLEMCRRFNDGMAAYAEASAGGWCRLRSCLRPAAPAWMPKSTAASTSSALPACSSAPITARAISMTDSLPRSSRSSTRRAPRSMCTMCPFR